MNRDPLHTDAAYEPVGNQISGNHRCARRGPCGLERPRQRAATQPCPRVLFFCSAEPEVASGTPVIVCDLLSHFPSGDAELLCEKSYQLAQRREISLDHRVTRMRFPHCLWPFRRGSRVRKLLAVLGFPWLVLVGCWRVIRFRPTSLVAIYFRPSWIFAAYLVSRICRVPAIYYVHDALRDNIEGKQDLASRFVAWLETKALAHGRVMVLHPYLADHYRQRYGIECTVLRQVVRRQPRPARHASVGSAPRDWFRSAIYDNNARQLQDLAAAVASNPGLRLRIWTDASRERLAALGIAGERVEVGFESDHAQLLERLAECDLLYLPLAFADSGDLTTNALQYAFPTKSLDYLVAGPPILVHCPVHFELSRFFQEHRCAHVLNEGDPAALAQWLEAWGGGAANPDDDARRRAVEVFSPQENRRVLWNLLAEIAS